jgi:RNA-directed DNA polymerase
MAKWQKNQVVLASMAAVRGETLSSVHRGTKAMTASSRPESPVETELMEEVVNRDNLFKALHRVKANGGAPGMDGMTVQELPDFLRQHWPRLKEEVLKGAYRPQPVRRVGIPKPDGGTRNLGIPTALDRFIQQAVLQVLQKRWDRTFSDHSYGFRPGRSAHQAVSRAQDYIKEGFTWVVDLDLEKFFDRVNHDVLMGRLARRIGDKRLLKLIRAFLEAGVMEHGLVGPTDEGTPQGGPLSPILSNALLDDLDKELEHRGHRFVRYADDCNVYVRSERAGLRVMAGLKAFLSQRLKLKVNESKSAVARPSDRKFLGFTLMERKGTVKRIIAPKALSRFKERIRELTGRNRGISMERMVGDLSRYLRGWRGYFGFCETPWELERLEGWVRRRLRSFQWKQWRNGPKRFRELTARNVDAKLAAQTAASAHGPWRLSNSPGPRKAMTNAYFRALGLPNLVR